MASGSAIRGSRVGAGPMGEAERGDAAPRQRITFWCANGHETKPSFASDAAVPETWIIDPSGVVQLRLISKVTAQQLDTILQQFREQYQ